MKYLAELLAAAVACTGAVTSVAATERLHPKAIAFGWDTLYCEPEDILAHAEEFDRRGYDGVASPMQDTSIFAANWTQATRTKYAAIYGEFAKHPGLKETFITVNLQPTGRVSFKDNALWARVAQNMETLAWVAKESGLPGLLFDTEDYWKARQFIYSESVDRDADGLTYDQAAALARQRGKQVFEAAYAVYPEMKSLSLYLLIATPYYHRYADLLSPTAQIRANGDLWIAFVNGMLEAAPDTAEIFDGCEDAYYYRRVARSFDCGYTELHRRLQSVIEPENRAKYSRVIRMSFGMYLDMYTNPKGSTYYFGPRGQGTRADLFAENAAAAFRACDGYVWLYGEKHGFIDWGNVKMRRQVETFTNTTWEAELPGFDRTVRYAKDPYDMVLADLQAASSEKIRTIPVTSYPATFAKGQTNFLMTAMSPGKRYALVGEMRGPSARGMMVPANGQYDNWNYPWHYPTILSKDAATGWKRFAAYLPVPPDCDGWKCYLENTAGFPAAEFRNFKLIRLDD